jgi:hypothetical protein
VEVVAWDIVPPADTGADMMSREERVIYWRSLVDKYPKIGMPN